VVELGQSVLEAIWANAYGADELPLRSEQMIRIDLTDRQCGFVTIRRNGAVRGAADRVPS
jgi:hypothetical protein